MMFRETLYGRDGSIYAVRWRPWRWLERLGFGLRFHTFWRGDEDPDPHTHPWPFWSFPLTGYYEEVPRTVPADKTGGEWWSGVRYMPGETYNRVNLVRPFRWHYRSADYAHRVMYPERASGGFFETDTYSGIIPPARAAQAKWPIKTVVWTGRKVGSWGFLKDGELIPWRTYLGLES